MGHVVFPLFYFSGLLVSWYQVSGGLNCWLDIGEGIAVAGLGYAIAEAIVFRQKKAINRKDESARKAAHIISNLFGMSIDMDPGYPNYIILCSSRNMHWNSADASNNNWNKNTRD